MGTPATVKGFRQNYSMSTNIFRELTRNITNHPFIGILKRAPARRSHGKIKFRSMRNLNIQCAMTTSFSQARLSVERQPALAIWMDQHRPAEADKTPYIPADYLHETHQGQRWRRYGLRSWESNECRKI